jgi:hypothetical protein
MTQENKYTIEYAMDGRVRVANSDFETDWMAKPDDGQMLVSLGDGDEVDVVLVTFDNYDGDLESDSVFAVGAPETTEVLENVDPDAGEDEEEEEGDDEGEEGEGEDGDEEAEDDGDGDGEAGEEK